MWVYDDAKPPTCGCPTDIAYFHEQTMNSSNTDLYNFCLLTPPICLCVYKGYMYRVSSS